ncbi:hypothetical protein DGG96_18100 [Legionella qingyii]|uniref:Uncharacterized protein n=1 Tax=Legionella qingyii TaxID=2184757 RepID=A0A317TYU5_9GAMM|nr:hypothetical protein DGG96_18100 [Legionella qingyii]
MVLMPYGKEIKQMERLLVHGSGRVVSLRGSAVINVPDFLLKIVARQGPSVIFMQAILDIKHQSRLRNGKHVERFRGPNFFEHSNQVL